MRHKDTKAYRPKEQDAAWQKKNHRAEKIKLLHDGRISSNYLFKIFGCYTHVPKNKGIDIGIKFQSLFKIAAAVAAVYINPYK